MKPGKEVEVQTPESPIRALARHSTIPGKTSARLTEYLQERWIDDSTFNQQWSPLVGTVFGPRVARGDSFEPYELPEIGFNPAYETFSFAGGVPVDERTWKALQALAEESQDSAIGVFRLADPERQVGQGATPVEAQELVVLLTLDPSETWSEFNLESNPILEYCSAFVELFTLGLGSYLIFGDSGCWGLHFDGYATAEMTIVGCDPELSPAMRLAFQALR